MSKKKKQYARSTPQHVAENLLKREFHGNNLISYVLGHSNNNKLVFETLDQALGAVPGFL
ncbi:hypothetical protein OB236_25560 [Paenibacillus sp. WQ 127069]|uniref:Uncharacterized protein n=1 Tax=Paenibacillus baimaensis TaxID=2982185 RepID=A0ABT2ULG3_9BACL|nr:hypothetical protein [Paenibacillus sp. WQ 127069]MCU6795485.1 hypothetical protein [Paenibacillus sp. WQ 127069]